MLVSKVVLGNMLSMFRDPLVAILPLIHSSHLGVEPMR